MKRIGVLTSGGDAPGMNAAIRAVVRTAIYDGLEVYGIYRGYQGLLDNDIEPMGPRSVANIIQRGGTILRTARCEEFYHPEGRAKAAENLQARGIEGLVVIGGDGSFRGALKLNREQGTAVIGVPGTIDNDIYGTDVSIGYSTALNVGLEAVDRLRDTAASHDRLFLVEVMGRRSGHIALHVGVAGGAEAILIPEEPIAIDEVAAMIRAAEARGKSSSIIVVAEGAFEGGALALQREVEARTGFEIRTVILGHTQRGGAPSTRDRVLASRLGYHAVKALIGGMSSCMVGTDRRTTVFVPLEELEVNKKDIDRELLDLAHVLAI
ncbi:MAG: 6-phosphofructokinase [Trueperaceae bacterium]|nr:6-phosphofructokinase [Trueperaceae bacterium]